MFRDMRVEGVAIETDHSIPTRLLRNVKRVVCRTNESVATGDAGMGPSGDTKARRPFDRAAVEGECTRLHFLAHALGERHGRIEDGAGQEKHEFLTPVTPNAVDLLARFVLENARELFEHRVA